jgi:hypothetical protein
MAKLSIFIYLFSDSPGMAGTGESRGPQRGAHAVGHASRGVLGITRKQRAKAIYLTHGLHINVAHGAIFHWVKIRYVKMSTS